MLEVWHRASRVDRHEQAFLARHDQILKWSRQLCADRPWQAEDLAQDAFVQFMAMRPDLDRIGNLDGYLFTLVRNLYRSPLYRNWPLRPVSLSILDFDSIEDGLRSIDRNAKEHLRKVAQNLTAICEFACQRKETSKAGSLLILRFFHGFGVHETAAIMGISRAAVDERLRLARKEAHEYLLERVARAGGKLVALKEPDELGQGARADSDLLDALEKRIFAAARGPLSLETGFRTNLSCSAAIRRPRHIGSHRLLSCMPRRCLPPSSTTSRKSVPERRRRECRCIGERGIPARPAPANPAMEAPPRPRVRASPPGTTDRR